MNITLYHYWRSSASWRVRYALAYKKITYKEFPVNLLGQEEKKTTYIEKNPNGYVPCLTVDGYSLIESIPIIEWLEENYPSPTLIFGDRFQRANIRGIAEIVNSGIQPLQNLDVLRKISTDKEEQILWAKHWNERGLHACEKILSRVRKPDYIYAFGLSPSLADICLIPQCYSSLRNNVDLNQFPIIASIYEYAKTTSYFLQSCPEAFEPKGSS